MKNDLDGGETVQGGIARQTRLFVIACLTISGILLACALTASRPDSIPTQRTEAERQPDVAATPRLANVETDPAKQRGASAALPYWSPVDPETAGPSAPPLPIPIDDARLVELQGNLRNWEVGDPIELAIPHIDAAYTAVIERIDTAFGRRAYSGRLEPGDAVLNSFLITVGPASTFATLVTPRGAFELVGNTRFAWMMSTRAMYAYLPILPPDYHIPPRNRDGS